MHNEQHMTKGFSLIEIMIALAIMALVGTIGILSYNGLREGARKQTTQTNLKTLKQTISLFEMNNNSYPTRLADLVERPKGDLGKKWTAPLLTHVPQDGWGQDFVYKLTPGGKHPYQLFSFGGGDGPNEAPENRLDAWDL